MDNKDNAENNQSASDNADDTPEQVSDTQEVNQTVNYDAIQDKRTNESRFHSLTTINTPLIHNVLDILNIFIMGTILFTAIAIIDQLFNNFMVKKAESKWYDIGGPVPNDIYSPLDSTVSDNRMIIFFVILLITFTVASIIVHLVISKSRVVLEGHALDINKLFHGIFLFILGVAIIISIVTLGYALIAQFIPAESSRYTSTQPNLIGLGQTFVNTILIILFSIYHYSKHNNK